MYFFLYYDRKVCLKQLLLDISHKGYVPSNTTLTTANATTTTCRLPIKRIDIIMNKTDDPAFFFSLVSIQKMPKR